jgi:ADP-ribose pyrophosphatase YjhB (NUDIX family)
MLVKVHALLWDGDRLVVHESHRQAVPRLTLPGGRVTDREPVKDALRREVREELGIDVRVTGLRYVAEVVYGHAVHDLVLVFGADPAEPLPSDRRSVDPRDGDSVVLPPLLDVVAADGHQGPAGTRWLGNIWRPAE